MNKFILILAKYSLGINTRASILANVYDVLRRICINISVPFLWLITAFYKLLPIMAKIGFLLVDDKTISKIYQRVEIILGILMIFKLTIELVKMLANPDLMTDKEKGIGGIFRRIGIALVLLAIVPFIFKEAYRIQNAVLEGNLIGKIIMVNNTDVAIDSHRMTEYGREMSWYTLNAFYYTEDEEEPCGTLTGKGGSLANTLIYTLYGKVTEDDMMDDIVSGKGYGRAVACTTSKKNDNVLGTYEYSMVYYPLFSIAFIVYILWLILSYAIALALRAVQLAFLQIIAPVPIISYIGKKDGTFSKWVAQCIDTYLDVFIRMATMYFTIFIIHQLNAGNVNIIENLSIRTFKNGTILPFLVADNAGTYLLYKMVVRPLMLIGLLKFTKKAPEMIKELFPKNSAAAIEREPNKKLAGTIGGMVVTGLTMAAGNAINRTKNNKNAVNALNTKADAFEKAGNFTKAQELRNEANELAKRRRKDAIRGALVGGVKGNIQGGYKGYKSGVGAAFQGALASNKEYDKWLQEGGTNEFSQLGSSISRYFGLSTPYQNEKEKLEAQRKAITDMETMSGDIKYAKQTSDSAKNFAAGQIDKQKANIIIDGEVVSLHERVNEEKARVNTLTEKAKQVVGSTKLINVDPSGTVTGTAKDAAKALINQIYGLNGNDTKIEEIVNKLGIDWETATDVNEEDFYSKLVVYQESRANKSHGDNEDTYRFTAELLSLFGAKAGSAYYENHKGDPDLKKVLDSINDDVKLHNAAQEDLNGLLRAKVIEEVKDAAGNVTGYTVSSLVTDSGDLALKKAVDNYTSAITTIMSGRDLTAEEVEDAKKGGAAALSLITKRLTTFENTVNDVIDKTKKEVKEKEESEEYMALKADDSTK